MVRTQVQLTEQQAKAVKAIAMAQGVSMAEVIRRAVDAMVLSSGDIDAEEKRRRAIQVVGKFSSGKRDVSKSHDLYLTEAYEK
jgi:hypothetical protein